MYHLPAAQKKYDIEFVEKFMQENEHQSKFIRGWRRDPNKNKWGDKGMYVIASINAPYRFVVAMMCRLFGYADTQKFSDQWVPLIEVASNSYVMD